MFLPVMRLTIFASSTIAWGGLCSLDYEKQYINNVELDYILSLTNELFHELFLKLELLTSLIT